MKLLSLFVIAVFLLGAPVAEATVQSGNWNASSELFIAGFNKPITKGPVIAYVNASSQVIDISLTMDSSTQRFHAEVNGNQLKGTLFSSSGMGAFETPFSGEISEDGNQITINLDWVWSYNGKRDQWVKKANTYETWTFTR